MYACKSMAAQHGLELKGCHAPAGHVGEQRAQGGTGRSGSLPTLDFIHTGTGCPCDPSPAQRWPRQR